MNVYSRLDELNSEYLVPRNWYLETFDESFYMDFHTHSQFEIMYCRKGSFCFEYQLDPLKSQIEQVSVYENSLILINTGYFHRLFIESDNTKISNIEFDALKTIESGAPISMRFALPCKELFGLNRQLQEIQELSKPFYIFNDTQNVNSTLKSLVMELNEPIHSDSTLRISLMILQLFLEISRCTSSNPNVNTGFSYIKKSMSYMKLNFQQGPKIRDIALKAGISEAYLGRLYKKELGRSIHDVLTEIKLDHAKYLLETSGLNTSEVAKLCGLKNREQLIYQFKKRESCSPNDYRKSLHEKSIRHFANIGHRNLNQSDSDQDTNISPVRKRVARHNS